MFYATLDSDGSRISQNAKIAAFETDGEARDYLLRAYIGGGWNMASAKIGEGYFGDCWIKLYGGAPIDDADYLAPFTRDQVLVRGPGQHPGGRAWWIEPTVPVLVVESIQE